MHFFYYIKRFHVLATAKAEPHDVMRIVRCQGALNNNRSPHKVCKSALVRHIEF